MDDVISRQAVVECVYKALRTPPLEGVFTDTMSLAIRMVNDLPSAQPERKKGHWVEIGDEPYDEWECDVCGFVIDGSGCVDPEEYRDVYKYCPRCGADMRGEQDEAD